MFEESVKIDLSLIIGGNTYTIPGGNVKDCSLGLRSYGFSGDAGFWKILDTTEDDLFAEFMKPGLIEVRISISSVLNSPEDEPEPLIVNGIVTEKSVREETYKDVSGKPVLHRYYKVSFKDAPKALWSQHFPIDLYVGKNMKDIIRANVVEGITVDLDFGALRKTHDMICFAMGNTGNEASFYDFLIWYIDSNNGVSFYDYKNQIYCLADRKTTEKQSVYLKAHGIKSINIHMPETKRHNTRVLNATADSPKTIDVEHKQAVSGITRDILVRTEIAMELDTKKSLEQVKLKHRLHELELEFIQYPAVTFRPGSSVSFNTPEWSDSAYYKKKKYRVFGIDLKAIAKEPAAGFDYNSPFTVYQMEMSAQLEHEDNPVAYSPCFKKPSYPLRVEGKIVSLAGKPTDKTYQIFSDPTTSEDYYSVFIPLWNSPVMVPFIPDITTGHFFFPAFTDTRVLLNFYYDRAEIVDYLDWGEGTRLSMDSQGNHILFGKNDVSKTSMKYVYKDNKPVFSIERISGVDTELIKMEDGGIVLQTKEDGSLKKVKETFDLTPKVAAASAKLAMEKSAAVADLSGNFESTNAEVTGKLDAAVQKAKTELEKMDTEISGKADEIESDIKNAVQQLGQNEGKLKAATEKTKKELMDNLTL